MKMKPKSGGGATSNKLVKPGGKVGPPSTNKYNPKGVQQIGTAVDPLAVEKLHTGTAPQVPSGNAVAWATERKPGGSRTIYKTGSQSQHGPVRQSEPDYGKDVPATGGGWGKKFI
jgi:hypothetical protein